MTERSQRKEDKKKIMGYLRTPFTSSDIVRQTKGQREGEGWRKTSNNYSHN